MTRCVRGGVCARGPSAKPSAPIAAVAVSHPAIRKDLIVAPALDYEAVVQQASGAIQEVVSLTHDLKRVTTGLSRGEGTLGQLVTNRQMYDQVNSTLTRISALMARLENPRGTIGRLLDDPTLYYSLNRAIASADTVISQINRADGSVGRLLRAAHRPVAARPATPDFSPTPRSG